MIFLVLGLVILGVCLELLKSQLPIDPTIMILIRLVIVVAVVYYILVFFGVSDFPVPRAR